MNNGLFMALVMIVYLWAGGKFRPAGEAVSGSDLLLVPTYVQSCAIQDPH